MDYQKKVSEIIELALTEKTFSLEVIDKIKSLRDDVISLSEKLEQANKTIEDLRKEKTEINFLLNKANEKLSNIDTRETELIKKEKEQEKLRYELSFQQQRANEIKELFSTVFRNPVILKSATKQTPYGGQNGNYPSTIQTNETETKQTT